MIRHIVRFARIAALVFASAILAVADIEAATIKIATWNLEHLAERDGAGCRPRVEKDYETLRYYARKLEADVIAFQEVESIAAAHRVFDPAVYRVEISQRPHMAREECRDLAGNFLTAQRVGLAIRKHIPYARLRDYKELGVSGTRWGVEILVYPRTTPVSLLSIHLKSGCFSDPLNAASSNPSCAILAEQRSLLEEWIDRHAARGERFIILGDFNRRLNVAGDEFWREIDDSEPNLAADLERATAGHLDTACHPKYTQLIDHIVLDRGTDLMARENTLRTMRYTESWEQRPSDHCPVSIDVVLNDGLHSGLEWVRRSAEYRALALDIYEQARNRIKEIARERQQQGHTAPWVVSIDADATILDNSRLDVAGELTFQPLTYAQLNAWVHRAAAEPVPGVMSFLDTVIELGGKIAIITNRSHRHHASATLNNLRKWGITIDPQTVCILGRMPQDGQTRNPTEWRTFGYKNDKDRRRRLLTEGKADLCWAGTDNAEIRQSWQRPHDIVMYLGDNIQDFPKFEQHEIARHPQRASDRIGIDLFLLPNPIYGSWK